MTEKDFNQARRESLKRAMTGNNPVETQENQQDTQSQENNLQKDEKKLDFNEKNSYIKNESVETPPEEETTKLQSILENTFGGDPLKAAKSWREAQSFAAQLKQQLKEVQRENESIMDTLERYPELGELVERAYKGEDIQNFFRSKEPEGKPASSTERQLDSPDTITVEMLSEAGLVKASEFEFLSEAQKAERIRQAKLTYQQIMLPTTIAKKAAEEFQKQIEEKQAQQELQRQEQTNRQLNTQRWKSGIELAAETFGLEFAGKDSELLDDIEKYAKYYRDPDNPNVIDEEAVYLATQRVLRAKGINPIPKDYKQITQEAQKNVNEKLGVGFNVNRKVEAPPTRPVSIAEKLRQARIQKELTALEKRGKYRRTDK